MANHPVRRVVALSNTLHVKISVLRFTVLAAFALVASGCFGSGDEGSARSEAEALYKAGLAHQEQGSLVDAISAYDEAIGLYPRYGEAYYSRGLAYADLGETKKAMEDYADAIFINSRFAEAFNTGVVALGQRKRSVDEYDQIIRRNPQASGAYAGRAVAYIILGKDEEADQDAEKAVELGFDPDILEDAIQDLKRQRQ